MSGPRGHDAAIGLLESALDYTRAVLGHLDADPDRPADLTRPTPCRDWDLGRLLAHLEDSLDAFAEGAHGAVSLDPRVPAPVRAAALRRKACHLLGSWSAATAGSVTIGGRPLPTSVVAGAAALEVTVHGWDVAATLHRPDTGPSTTTATASAVSTGPPAGPLSPIPPGLASALLEVASAMVDPADRRGLFAAPRATTPEDDPETRLLAFLGRDRSRPVTSNPAVRRTRPPWAS